MELKTAPDVSIHEGAWAVIDRFARERHVVGVHHAVNEADQLPARDQPRLPFDDGFKERDIGLRRSDSCGKCRARDVVGQRADRLLVVSMRGGLLQRADPHVARGNSCQHRSLGFASRNTGSPVVTTASLRVVGMPRACIPHSRHIRAASARAPRDHLRRRAYSCRPAALQLNVESLTGRRDLLAEQDRPSIAERGEVAELVPRIRLRYRMSTLRECITGENRRAFGSVQCVGNRVRARQRAAG